MSQYAIIPHSGFQPHLGTTLQMVFVFLVSLSSDDVISCLDNGDITMDVSKQILSILVKGLLHIFFIFHVFYSDQNIKGIQQVFSHENCYGLPTSCSQLKRTMTRHFTRRLLFSLYQTLMQMMFDYVCQHIDRMNKIFTFIKV